MKRFASKSVIAAVLSVISGPLCAAPVVDLIHEKVMASVPSAYAETARVEVTIQGGANAEAELITDFKYNDNNGFFIAQTYDAQNVRANVSGIAVVYLDAPITTRKINKGDVIQAEDIELQAMPLARLKGFSSMSADDVIGKEAKRFIAAGKPIPTQSITTPVAVSRGDRVKIILKQGRMMLEGTGRAMGSGSVGEEIRVVNTNGNKSIAATIKSQGVVEIVE